MAGITKESHAGLPLPLKLLYRYLLTVPHMDKIGAERVVAHVADWPGDTEWDGEPDESIMGPGDWRKGEGLPEKGSLKDVVVIRPPLLTDGECVAEKVETKGGGKAKGPYRVQEGTLSGGWTVSRKDVSHFLVEGVIKNWREWKGKCVSIAY